MGYDIGVEGRSDPRILKLVALTTVEPEDKTALDAEVVVELDDGKVLRRTAQESPRTLIFQDRARATQVLEQRLARGGSRPGTGKALSDCVFTALDRGSKLDIRAVLDSFQPAR